ncbi:protein-disulfide reductase DsbD family protein [Lichenifustis flavocetrariae]|uniref:Thioredoxin family protein n=1 Tax=Lichenifustis flavocetrariae TaxID=2949735 RepID=A0AA41Z4Q7_9HYPH|nr:protein-disulfide reductase DsbD domain-containing protein [Lichenifustis flavocetrariae]MCW6510433.1 thioredoxin family protein [Lichenifustis flavocetrariae]
MTRPLLLRAAYLAGTMLGVSIGPAGAAATDWIGDGQAAVRLVTASDTAKDGMVTAGLEFRYGSGWHGYWRTPGDAGIAPVLDWSASTNLKTAALSWPAPTRLIVSGLQNSVYTGQFTLPVAIGLTDHQAGTRLALSVDYAACGKVCVPKHADLALNLAAGPGAASAEAAGLAAARQSVPQLPATAGIDVVRTALEGAGPDRRLIVVLRSAAAPFMAPDLFVEGAGAGLPPPPTVQLADGDKTAVLTTSLATDPAAPLTLTVVDGPRSATFAGPGTVAPQAARPPLTRWAILGSALLGGLILNLMPCVLPILSIKLFALAGYAGAGRAAARRGALATAAGILTSFLLLATALIVLKWSGAELGWGIQFQQPWFLAGMAVLTTLFAASFFEWLPIRLPQAIARLGGSPTRGPLVGAFLSGAVSTLLATPCSAPFVGTAVGFALAGGPRAILVIFLSLGLGMSLPFLAVAIHPGLVAWLPRPGAWMVRLRQGLGLLLLGTTVWLLVVLGSVAGTVAAGGAASLLAITLALRAWVAYRGRIGEPGWPGLATAGLAMMTVAAASLPTAALPQRSEPSDSWQAFDPTAIDRLVRDGKTVLVDVTASWCLTCKVNELTTLDTAVVQARLAQPGTVRMRADWSRPDPVISAFLQRFSRFGIPLDAVFGPHQPGGEALPELLTAGIVVQALDGAAIRQTDLANTMP